MGGFASSANVSARSDGFAPCGQMSLGAQARDCSPQYPWNPKVAWVSLQIERAELCELPMSDSAVFRYTFSVPKSAIDEYGHVNNVVYVEWMQEAAIRHVGSIRGYQPAENTGWFAREHRIEYLTPAYEGDEIEVNTWLVEMKRVRAHRKYEFHRKSDGKLIARGETQWIYVDLKTGRPIAIPAELLALFPVAG